MRSAVDIIVPIYNAAADVRQCLHALLDHTPSFARVILADDASTDPTLPELFGHFQERAQFKVERLQHTQNLGFVGNVNAALRHSKNDALILNSDTLVTSGWLEAMSACLRADSHIASVTPWSNNAEICSFPELCVAAPPPKELKTIAAACAAMSPTYPSLPTGVGFCMLMRRSVLERIGTFDAALFGRGYGEENDFCD